MKSWIKNSMFALASLGLTFSFAPIGTAAAGEEVFVSEVVKTGTTNRPEIMYITVKKWTSDKERKALIEKFVVEGQEELKDAIDATDHGYIRMGQKSIRLNHAVNFPQSDGGRIVRILTERPIRLRGAAYATNSEDYLFSYLEFQLDENGKGHGIAIPAAEITLDEHGQVKIKAYSTPHQMVKVKVKR